jgi:hypothetical protein
MTAWRDALGGEGEPVRRVEAATEQGMADPKRAVADLAALAADADAPATTRVMALAALGRIAAIGGVPVPDLTDVVGAEPVIAAAIALGMADALTGVISQLPDGPYERITRKMIGFRLLAAGVRGPHVTRVLADAGELDGAAQAIADDFIASLLPAVRSPNRLAMAWAAELARLLDRHGARLAEPLRAALARRDGAIDAMTALLEQAGGATLAARGLLAPRKEAN